MLKCYPIVQCLKNIKVVMGGERGCQNINLYLLRVAFSFWSPLPDLSTLPSLVLWKWKVSKLRSHLLAWCPWVFCKWRYVFNLSHDLTRPFDLTKPRGHENLWVGALHIITTQTSLLTTGIVIVGIMLLICRMTSRNLVFIRLCDFMGESPSG